VAQAKECNRSREKKKKKKKKKKIMELKKWKALESVAPQKKTSRI
jgi:hypothetical protein